MAQSTPVARNDCGTPGNKTQVKKELYNFQAESMIFQKLPDYPKWWAMYTAFRTSDIMTIPFSLNECQRQKSLQNKY